MVFPDSCPEKPGKNELIRLTIEPIYLIKRQTWLRVKKVLKIGPFTDDVFYFKSGRTPVTSNLLIFLQVLTKLK